MHPLRERGATDRSELFAVLDAGLICHLGVIIDDSPVVLPTGYGRIGEMLYLHGSTGNRSFQFAQDRDMLTIGRAIPDPLLRPEIEVPAHIAALEQRGY